MDMKTPVGFKFEHMLKEEDEKLRGWFNDWLWFSETGNLNVSYQRPFSLTEVRPFAHSD